MDQDFKKVVVSLCMGSACHQFGVYGVLPVLRDLLVQSEVADLVEFKGAFCLGPCTKGIVIKVGSIQITGVNQQTLSRKFTKKILPAIRKQSGVSHE